MERLFYTVRLPSKVICLYVAIYVYLNLGVSVYFVSSTMAPLCHMACGEMEVDKYKLDPK